MVPHSDPIFHDFFVTTTASSGSGSLVQAMADAMAHGNQVRIIIDDSLSGAVIPLDAPLIDGSVNATVLHIVNAGMENVTVLPSAGNAFDFRFINHTGPNGASLLIEGLTIINFGAPADLFDPGHGGAIYSGYAMTITDTEFDANTAFGSGGAIYHSVTNGTMHPVTLTGCEFLDNAAMTGSGGAVYYYTANGTLTISNSATTDTLFSGNTAVFGHGGAIYQYGGYIDAVTPEDDPPNFVDNLDDGDGNSMYLVDLAGATIDVGSIDGDNALYLVSAFPPSQPIGGPTINLNRFADANPITNWEPGWFY